MSVISKLKEHLQGHQFDTNGGLEWIEGTWRIGWNRKKSILSRWLLRTCPPLWEVDSNGAWATPTKRCCWSCWLCVDAVSVFIACVASFTLKICAYFMLLSILWMSPPKGIVLQPFLEVSSYFSKFAFLAPAFFWIYYQRNFCALRS